jgi:exopolyphosphatase / guanosine-5'-triphosphate,3'-diphosphate pyrophosphatase
LRTLAVLDIGSNTVLVTIGRLRSDGEVEVLWDEGQVVRMSEGLQDGGNLKPEAKQRVLNALENFQHKARLHGATEIQAAGTAAFRRARDGENFAREIFDRLGIPVRILSGDEEARYSFASAQYYFAPRKEDLGMIDIGGGSTEFVFSENGPRFSLPLGTVRLTEARIKAHPIADPEWRALLEEIDRILRDGMASRPKSPASWAAVAATPASLATVLLELPIYQPEKIHGFPMKKSDLENLLERLRSLSLEDRKELPGMHPDRAELLPVGGAILWRAMEFLELDGILVSDHGLRYGILHEELIGRRKQPSP